MSLNQSTIPDPCLLTHKRILEPRGRGSNIIWMCRLEILNLAEHGAVLSWGPLQLLLTIYGGPSRPKPRSQAESEPKFEFWILKPWKKLNTGKNPALTFLYHVILPLPDAGPSSSFCASTHEIEVPGGVHGHLLFQGRRRNYRLLPPGRNQHARP